MQSTHCFPLNVEGTEYHASQGYLPHCSLQHYTKMVHQQIIRQARRQLPARGISRGSELGTEPGSDPVAPDHRSRSRLDQEVQSHFKAASAWAKRNAAVGIPRDLLESYLWIPSTFQSYHLSILDNGLVGNRDIISLHDTRSDYVAERGQSACARN
ncbi:hypothetical protein EJ02DRAFT_113386 [Clathrospora elynae]|uniref:Uncharacterized protein n=1 Tax=Clathrospora elynae TaxID=706981 RepID=A0A6A5SVW2_9PLEO|nr:hypothetical protein EJ02DRAFT_113386 [Clathrospora elynae]